MVDFPNLENSQYAPIYWVFFWLTVIIAVISFVYIYIIIRNIKKAPTGNDAMHRVHNAILEGAHAYLKRQYQTVLVVLVIVFAVLLIINIPLGVSFFIGALSSLISSYLAMYSSTMANVRVTEAARSSVNRALKIGFNAGMVIGVGVISISTIGIVILYMLYDFTVKNIIGYGFGASFAALFAQVGGGIYTKGADVGADIVGKLEHGLPEDDFRNPATIADNVGDNVGDCAGRGADLFESSSANNIGAMIIGVTLSAITGNPLFIIISLITRALGNVAAMIGGFFVKMKTEEEDPVKALGRGLYITAIVTSIMLFLVSWLSFGAGWVWLFIDSMIGIVLGILAYVFTTYYTDYHYRPVKEVIESSVTGAATNVINGFALGLESTGLPVLSFIVGILLSFKIGEFYAEAQHIELYQGGIYGTVMATISLLSFTTIILAADGFGPVSDNAAGIAEMAHLEQKVRDNLDRLDAVGNTTKALAKGFGLTSAALSAILLFEAYLDEIRSSDINIYHPVILVSLLMGGLIPFVFSSMVIKGTGKAAGAMIKEIRRQFKADPGILKGETLADFSKCIDIATKTSLKEMILPGLMAIGVPIVWGFIFGADSIGALLVSGLLSGMYLGFVMNTGGGALDNTKKAIETGLKGGKGSPAHEASIVGDTFGDPLKDTAGPSLHILIKLLFTVSIAFASLFVQFGGWITL